MENLECLNQETILLLKKHNCLNGLISSVLVERAIDSVEFSKEELKNIEEKIKQEYRISKEVSLNAWLKEKKITMENYITKIVLPYKLNKYCLDNFKNKTEARFLSKKDNLDVVVYSVIRVKDLYLAKELYQRINEGEADFSDVASKYSEGPEKMTRGLVGPIPLGKAMGPLKDLLKSSKPGQIRQPIHLVEWYHLVRLESITHAELNENMIIDLSRELFYEWINSEVEAQIEKLFERFPTKENILV